MLNYYLVLLLFLFPIICFVYIITLLAGDGDRDEKRYSRDSEGKCRIIKVIDHS